MGKRTLYLEPEFDYDFELLSIVSPIRDYRLCWYINKALKIDFARQDEIQIRYPKKSKYGYFDLYFYDDELNWLQYYFINNRSLGEHLIPEMKQVDHFLMVKGGNAEMEMPGIIERLKKIDHIQAMLQVDPSQLRSKQNLILE